MNDKHIELNAAQVSLAKALGMLTDSGTLSCSGRRGVVYFRHEGKVYPIATLHNGEPAVVDCEHEAMDLIERFYKNLALVGVHAILAGSDLPHVPAPEDFLYVFAEDVADEPEVTSTSDADALITQIKAALA